MSASGCKRGGTRNATKTVCRMSSWRVRLTNRTSDSNAPAACEEVRCTLDREGRREKADGARWRSGWSRESR
jgi:hypothetical protein